MAVLHEEGIIDGPTYMPPKACSPNYWTGAAVQVNGGYRWANIYEVAEASNVIVVGGGCPVRLRYSRERDLLTVTDLFIRMLACSAAIRKKEDILSP